MDKPRKLCFYCVRAMSEWGVKGELVRKGSEGKEEFLANQIIAIPFLREQERVGWTVNHAADWNNRPVGIYADTEYSGTPVCWAHVRLVGKEGEVQ